MSATEWTDAFELRQRDLQAMGQAALEWGAQYEKRLKQQDKHIARVEAENAALWAIKAAAVALSVAVDDWDAGEMPAEHLIQTNDDFHGLVYSEWLR